MTFTLNKDNIPVRFPYYGRVLVAGHWSTENKAVLIVMFIDMEIGTSWYAVEKVSTFPVIKKEAGIAMVYCSGDINIQTDLTDPSGNKSGHCIQKVIFFFIILPKLLKPGDSEMDFNST